MTRRKSAEARCKQGRLVIADEHILLKSRRGLARAPRWTLSRANVTNLIPRKGHGVTLNLIIRSGDGLERRLDWLLPHDALRVATALGYEWTIPLMREMAAIHELGDATLAATPISASVEARPRVVVRPAVMESPEANVVISAGGPRRWTRVPVAAPAAVRTRASAILAATRARAMEARPMLAAYSAWLGEQLSELRALRLPKLSARGMKLLYLALFASLFVISSAGWLFPGNASSHSLSPQTRLVQVYGGMPPVIVTTPTPTPTVAPTEPPIITSQPTATPTPQPTATPPPQPTLGVTFTCAWATAFVSGQICVHTQPYAALSLNISYCSGQIVSYQTSGEWASVPTQGWVHADGNGNYTWTFVPKTRCVGPATATVTASWQGQSATNSTTFIVK